MDTIRRDRRAEAFCSDGGPRVFSSVAYAHQSFDVDPFDIVSVHAHARDAFVRLIDDATSGQPDAGHILLVRGAAGSGKTHLVRAFRSHVHGRRLGFVGQMQMTSGTHDYAQYVLTNLIDSLQRPYHLRDSGSSGLMILSDAVAQTPGGIEPDRIAALPTLDPDAPDPIPDLVDDLLRHPKLSDFDPDLLSVLLQLQRRDPPVSARVIKYLRCLDLTDRDRRLLGGIVPRVGDGEALRMLIALGNLVWATTEGALVLLVDQLEDMFNLDDVSARFPRATDVLRAVVDAVPTAVVVISCLDDMYVQVRRSLSQAALDRIEREPAPVTLRARRTLPEIESIVGRRLAVLYDVHDVDIDTHDPLYPFRRDDLARLENLRTRDAIAWCRDHRDRCIAEGQMVDAAGIEVEPIVVTSSSAVWSVRFNDARTDFDRPLPDDDDALLDLLADAAAGISAEVQADRSTRPATSRPRPDLLEVRLDDPSGGRTTLGIGICNKSAQGGWLARQIDEIETLAAPRRPVLVRCGPFPDGRGTQIAQRLGELLRAGGRRVVLEESDWRTIMAFVAFRDAHGEEPGFDTWIRHERPLSQRPALRAVFGLDDDPPVPSLDTSSPLTPLPESAPADAPPPPPRGGLRHALRLGQGPNGPVEIGHDQLRRHVSFLGGAGSGTTSGALHLLEQALEADLPVVLLDRGGELCTFADRAWWDQPAHDEAATARRSALAGRLEVALYTPGAPDGRPAAVPLLPSMAGLRDGELPAMARLAAEAVGVLLGYHGSASEHARLLILGKAIEVLAARDRRVGLGPITELVSTLDPELINAVGDVNPKRFGDLHANLVTLQRQRRDLVESTAPEIDPGVLFAPGPRLSVVTTAFLGDEVQIEFWVSRFFATVAAWAARRKPSDDLAGLLFVGEVDLYLPRQTVPATRDPAIALFRRARQGGLSLVLETQSPGGLDHRSTNVATQLFGRSSDAAALSGIEGLDPGLVLDQLSEGEFLVPGEGVVRAEAQLLEPKHLGDDQILAVAAAARHGVDR